MAIHLMRDLDRMQRDLLAMANLVEQAIDKSICALTRRDRALAREVIAGDSQIDDEENGLTEDCLKMLALHQPVARDLRRIAAALMITTDLERMGDLAEEIAERALVVASCTAIPMPDKLQRMAHLTTLMVRESLDAFVNLHLEQAERVLRMDDEVDRYNNDIIGELIRTMQSSPALIEGCLSLFSATRHVEGIADLATNIAEDVIYLIGGNIVRHRRPPGG